MRRLYRRWYILPVVAVLGVAAFALVGALHQVSGGSPSGSTSSGGGQTAAAPEPAKAPFGVNNPVAGLNRDLASAGSSGGSSSNGSSSTSTSSLMADYVTGRGRYLIRDGYLTMVVKRGQINSVVARMTSLTAAFDGYVVSSFVGTADDGGVVPWRARRPVLRAPPRLPDQRMAPGR